jgi:hypothetical protein
LPRSTPPAVNPQTSTGPKAAQDELENLPDAPQRAPRATSLSAMFGRGNEVAQPSPPESEKAPGAYVQWTTPDDLRYIPSGKTVARLTPGLYSIRVSPSIGLYFERVETRTEGLLRFPHSNCDAVVGEIGAFWDRKDVFADYGLPHKRGILLWGPPGSGKSSTIQLAMRDVVARGGIGVEFNDPGYFSAGMRVLRQIHPNTPVVVLMEDLDATLDNYSESLVLNVLDGVERFEHVVFLATTNYPEKLGARVVNRPSRFDKRFKVGHPTPESRAMYFRHLIGGRDIPSIDMDRWVRDSDGFSIAHMKELFVAVVILGDEYERAVTTLRGMREAISSGSNYGSGGKVGFGHLEVA